tara:strand:+ start:410 stop:550 length:141 start_codon:yes stop_codon:yes gene_type:complete
MNRNYFSFILISINELLIVNKINGDQIEIIRGIFSVVPITLKKLII